MFKQNNYRVLGIFLVFSGIIFFNLNITLAAALSHTKGTTVHVTPKAPVVSLSSSPGSVTFGGASTLSWSVKYASSCSSKGTDALPTSSITGTSWQTPSALGTISGSASTGNLNTNKTFNYILECTGPGGSTSASASVAVGAPANVALTFWADQTTINYNTQTTLRWTVSNAIACTSNMPASSALAAGVSGSVLTGNLIANKTYTLNCTGSGNPATASVTVIVNGDPGVCGTANNTTSGTPPSGGALCATAYGNSTITNNSDSWTWTCNGSSNGGAASGVCTVYKTAVCGSADGGNFYNSAPPSGAQLCNIGSAGAVSLNATNNWVWNCNNGSNSRSCSANLRADGVCFAGENGQNLVSQPTVLCSSVYGNTPLNFDSSLNKWSWNCSSLNGGSSPSCLAYKKIDGVCNSVVSGKTYSSLTSNPSFCNAGQYKNFSGTGPWSWDCGGINGGLDASPKCSVQKADCGTDNGGNFGALATSSLNLCNSNANLVAGSFNSTGTGWAWQCNGNGAGSLPVSCSATQSACQTGTLGISYTNPANHFYTGQTASVTLPASWSLAAISQFNSSDANTISVAGSVITAKKSGTTNIVATGLTDPSGHTDCSLSSPMLDVMDYSLTGQAVPPSIKAGDTTNINITISGFNGFSNNVVVLKQASLPAGFTISTNSVTINPGTLVSGTFFLQTDATTPVNTYYLTFTGTDALSGITKSVIVPVIVTAPTCVINTFTSNPVSPVPYNSTPTLSWSSSYANSCSASFGAGQPTSGSYTPTTGLTDTTNPYNYTITCQGAAGTPACSKSLTIQVSDSPVSCGSASSNVTPNASFASAPTTNLCGIGNTLLGTVNTDTTNNLYKWQCQNTANSITNCQAGIDVNGVCALNYDQKSYTANSLSSSSALCDKGNFSPISFPNAGPWSWDCTGINKGLNAIPNCSATLADCGSANNNNFGSLSLASANLCNSNATLVAGSFNSTGTGWAWQCNGNGPGSIAKFCSATQSACVNGNVVLADAWIYANKFTTASLPAGWTGSGSFVASPPAIVSITGNKITGQTGGGSVTISGNNYTDPTNHSNCSLTGTPLDVRDFKLTGQASPATIQAGSNSSFIINIIGIAGFDNVVNIPKITGLPAGASIVQNQIALQPTGLNSGAFTFNTTAATPTGSYTFTFTGTDPISGLIRTVDITINITAPTCVINTFTSNPVSPVPYNSTPTLSWNTSYTSGNCTATGDWNGNYPTSGSFTTPNLTDENKIYSYTLTCPSTGTAPACSQTINLSINAAPPACGSATTVTSPTPPTTNLCGPGNTASTVTEVNNTYIWKCTNSVNAFINCQAGKDVSGICAIAYNNKSFTSGSLTSSSALCDKGTIDSTFAGSGPWTWNCNGLNNGGTDYCNANLADCGAASGGSFGNLTSASANLCNSNASLVAGSFNSTATGWSWQCNGSGPTSNPKSCSATQSACQTGNVVINPPVPFYINNVTMLSPPLGWSGSGSFNDTPKNIVSIIGNQAKGILGGTANIDASGFTDPNGRPNCPLGNTKVNVADFSLAGTAADPSIKAGQGTTISVNINAINGFAHNVDVTNLPLPAIGMSLSPVASTLNPVGVFLATYNFGTQASTPPGHYKITFSGLDQLTNTTRTADVYIDITAPDCSITSFVATPPGPLNYNDSSLLSWQVSDANTCTASGSWSGNVNNVSGSYNTGNLTSTKTYSLTCQGAVGTNSCVKSTTIVVNAAPAACGNATLSTYPTAPTANLCGPANTPSAVGVDSVNNLWVWTCTSAGVFKNCSAGQDINAVCASAYNGKSFTQNYLTNSMPLCDKGTLDKTSLSATGPWNWNCNGINKGGTDYCSATLADCGAASGGSFGNLTSASANLCNSNASLVAGSFNSTGAGWAWQCNGSGPGSVPVSCSASQSACQSANVKLSKSNIYINDVSIASAPLGWSGSGSFNDTPKNIVSITSNQLKGVLGGSANISASGFTDPNGRPNCPLSSTPISVADFSLASAISQASIPAGNSAFITVSIAGQNNFAHNVDVTNFALPIGMQLNNNPSVLSTLNPGTLASDAFYLTTLPSTSVGVYTIKFSGFDALSNTTRTTSVTFNITAPACSIDSFTSSPANPIPFSSKATLNWSTSYVIGKCTAKDSWSGLQNTSGSYTTPALTVDQKYTLECQGGPGTPVCSQTIDVKVSPKCSSDSDCGVNDTCNTNKCMNAGTPTSYCAPPVVLENGECCDPTCSKVCTKGGICEVALGKCGPSAQTYPEGTTEPAGWSNPTNLCSKGIPNRGLGYMPTFPGPPTYVSAWSCCGGATCEDYCEARVGGLVDNSCKKNEGETCNVTGTNVVCECCDTSYKAFCDAPDNFTPGKCACNYVGPQIKYPPPQPGKITVDNSTCGQLKLYWGSSSLFANYNVFRQELASVTATPDYTKAMQVNTYSVYPAPTAASPFVDTVPNPGKNYVYWVFAYENGLQSIPQISPVTGSQVCGQATLTGDKDVASVDKLTITTRDCNGTDPLPNNFYPKTGQDIVFKLNICNAGNATATQVSVIDTMNNIIPPVSGNFNVKLTYINSSGSLVTVPLASTTCPSISTQLPPAGYYCLDGPIDDGISYGAVMKINLNDPKYQIGPRISLSQPNVATISYTAQASASPANHSLTLMCMNSYEATYFNGSSMDKFQETTSYINFSSNTQSPIILETR